jgi:hypothetical protein
VVQWCGDAAVMQWCSGAVVQWCRGAVVQRCGGAVVSWRNGALVQWCCLMIAAYASDWRVPTWYLALRPTLRASLVRGLVTTFADNVSL